jgi:hypothetical protein
MDDFLIGGMMINGWYYGSNVKKLWMSVKKERQREAQTSGQGQNRTADTRLFRPLLYRLSYLSRKSFNIRSSLFVIRNSVVNNEYRSRKFHYEYRQKQN